MFALRVNYWHRNAGQQPQRDEALLTVGEPIVFEGKCGAFEYVAFLRGVMPTNAKMPEPRLRCREAQPSLRAPRRVGDFFAAFPSAPSAHLLRLVPLLAAALRAAA